MTDSSPPSVPSRPSGSLPSAGAGTPELSIVLPVYNESEALPSVLDEWFAELDRLGIDAELLAYDDGSRDGSGELLERLAVGEPRLRVIRQSNRGHGPTILRGYREARGEWIFQVDSDGELGAEELGSLWRLRDRFDFLVGERRGRSSTLARRLVTLLSRGAVALLFGRGVRDVNSPFRLMRRSRLAELLADLPLEPFAPNVLLSGLAVARGLRIVNLPVRHQARRGGSVSLTSGRLWRGAWRTLLDALATSRRARKDGQKGRPRDERQASR